MSAVEDDDEESEEEERESVGDDDSGATTTRKTKAKTRSKSTAVLGYILGKVEGKGNKWHGHITALAVAPSARRSGLAKALVAELERRAEEAQGRFVDLFVRASNERAIKLYEGLGYVTYRRVVGYYSGGGSASGSGANGAKEGEAEGANNEDALDMRKSLPADGPGKPSMVPLGRDIAPHELEFD